MDFCWTLLFLFVLYKILDRLIRIPKRNAPTSLVDNILITGCDTGFGRIFALRMDRMGFRVFASCLTDQGKADLEKASGSGKLKAFIMDVADSKSVQEGYKFVSGFLSDTDGLWGVVNNAGIIGKSIGPIEWLDKKDYEDTCAVNTFGLIDVTRTFLPLVKKKRGRIVNTASIVGRVGFPGSAPYVVSKFGVEGFSETLRPEVKVFGISVHIIEPGFHNTALLHIPTVMRMNSKTWEKLPPHLKEEYPEDYAAKSNEIVKKLIPKFTSNNLEEVVDCYEHALLGYFPRGRYMPGKDVTYIWWPLSLVPEWLSDWFFNRDPDRPIPRSCRAR